MISSPGAVGRLAALLLAQRRKGTALSGWATVAEAIGLPGVSVHCLRHTHASMLIDAGIDLVRISKQLGHADPSITLRVYAHLFQKRDDKSTDAIDAAVGGFGN